MEDKEYIEDIQGDLKKSLARIDFLMKEIQSYKKQNNICDISIKSHIHNTVDKARQYDKNQKNDIQKYDIQKYNYFCILGMSILITSGFFIYTLTQLFI